MQEKPKMIFVRPPVDVPSDIQNVLIDATCEEVIWTHSAVDGKDRITGFTIKKRGN